MAASHKAAQLLLEILAAFDGDSRATQTIIEIIERADSVNIYSRVTEVIIEVMERATSPDCRVTQVIIEVLQGNVFVDSYVDESADTDFAF